MIFFLNALLVLIGVFAIGARMYEIDNLLREFSMLNGHPGIISNYMILALVLIIALCTSVLMWTNKSFEKYTSSVVNKFFTLLAGALFIGVFLLTMSNMQWYTVYYLIGGVGFVIFSLIESDKKLLHLIYIIPILTFGIRLCLQSIVLDVSTTSNTDYLFNSISSILLLTFTLYLFRTILFPKISKAYALSFFSVLAFISLGVAYTADFLFMFPNVSFSSPDTYIFLGYTCLAIFSLLTFTSLKSQVNFISAEDFEDIYDESVVLLDTDKPIQNTKTKEDISPIITTPFDEDEDEEFDKSAAFASLFGELPKEELDESSDEEDLKTSSFIKADDNLSIEKPLENLNATADTQKLNEDEENLKISDLFSQFEKEPVSSNVLSLFPEENIRQVANEEIIENTDITQSLDENENIINISSLFSQEKTNTFENEITQVKTTAIDDSPSEDLTQETKEETAPSLLQKDENIQEQTNNELFNKTSKELQTPVVDIKAVEEDDEEEDAEAVFNRIFASQLNYMDTEEETSKAKEETSKIKSQPKAQNPLASTEPATAKKEETIQITKNKDGKILFKSTDKKPATKKKNPILFKKDK